MSSYLSVAPFVRAVAQTGSFTAAARELGFSQPAVSQRIRRFERELGVPLFLRTPAGVRPTQAGEILLRRLVDAFSSIETARQEIESLRDLRSGLVRIAAFPSISTSLLPLAIAALRDRHPNIRVSFRQLSPPLAIESVLDGSADLGVIYSYDDKLVLPGRAAQSITSQLLLVDPLNVALSRRHPLAWREQIALADLANEAWLVGHHADHLANAAREAGFVPREIHSVLDYTAAQAFVAADLGIAVMPGLASMSNRHPGIVCRRLLPAMSRTVHTISLDAASPMPALRAMLGALNQAAADIHAELV